jgi:uncharacterized repeat protein (TIGR03803 family)
MGEHYRRLRVTHVTLCRHTIAKRQSRLQKIVRFVLPALFAIIAIESCSSDRSFPSFRQQEAAGMLSPARAPAPRSTAVESLLYQFPGPPGGEYPLSGLATDKHGNLFGGTFVGGTGNSGVLFELARTGQTWKESDVFTFEDDGSDGASPSGALVIDEFGDIFGATIYGGYSNCPGANCGSIYELSPLRGGGYLRAAIYLFKGGSDGGQPRGGLLAGAGRAFYGTTAAGGPANVGTVFEATLSGRTFIETTLYAFKGGPDGAEPQSQLVMDAYGTTASGGTGFGCQEGCGTVFKLTPAGSAYAESVIYDFQGGADGSEPTAGLIPDGDGSFLGTTESGGVISSGCTSGCGTVFRLTPKGNKYDVTFRYNFQSGGDAAYPNGGLVMGPHHQLYGSTGGGGAHGEGAVYALVASGKSYEERVVYSFTTNGDGQGPDDTLIVRHGSIFGSTIFGGDSNAGTVFEVTPFEKP